MKKTRRILSLALVVLMLTGACISLPANAETIINQYNFDGSNPLNGWTRRSGVIMETSAEIARSGNSLKLTQVGNNESHYVVRYMGRVYNNKTYELSLWMYLPSELTGTGVQNRAFVDMISPAMGKQYVSTAGAWTNITTVFTWTGADNAEFCYHIGFEDTVAADSVLYVDDVKLVEYQPIKFDGSMEDLSVWSVSGAVSAETGIVQNGESALKIEGVGDATQVAVILDKNKNFSGCVKTGAGYTEGYAKIRIYDGKYAGNLICEKEVPVSSVWTAVPFGAIEPVSGMALIELVNEGTGTVYFDSFKFTEYVDTTNLLANPGFEGTINPASTGTLSTEQFHDGEQSLKLAGANQRYFYLGKGISVAAQESYTVSFYYYANGTKPTIYIYPIVGGKEGDALVCSTLTNSMNSWKKGNYTFTVPAEISTINVQLGFGTLNDAPAYIDDMSLTAEPAPESTFLTSDDTVLCELSEGTQAVTSNYVVEAEEAGTCLYVIAGYKINKTTGVRTLDSIKLFDKAITAGTNQLTETIDITVADTDTYRYELKSYALDMQNGKLAPIGKYNNIRSN